MNIKAAINRLIITLTIILFISPNSMNAKDIHGFWIKKDLKWEKDYETSKVNFVHTRLYHFQQDSVLIIFSGYIAQADPSPDTLNLWLTEGGSVFKGTYKIDADDIIVKYSFFKGIKKTLIRKAVPRVYIDTLRIIDKNNLAISDTALVRMTLPVDEFGYNAVFADEKNEGD